MTQQSRMVPGLALLLCLGTAAPALGGLTWEAKRFDLPAKEGVTELVAEFRFTNTGPDAVTVRDLRVSCDCTTAEIGKRDYAPGESGVVRAILRPGDRMGPLESEVSVFTSDPADPLVSLVVHTALPELLSYSDRTLRWKKGAAASEQSIQVDLRGPQAILTIEPKDSALAKQFGIRIDVVTPGRSYRLSFKPGTEQELLGPAEFFVTFADHTRRSFRVMMFVR